VKSGFDIEEGETRIFARGSRKLAWMASGDPAGFPVFFAHGCPGSRLEVAFLADQARNQGFRIIGFDRPGFGRSDFVDGYGLRSFAEDLNALADDLDIKKFGLIGWSSGGPRFCRQPFICRSGRSLFFPFPGTLTSGNLKMRNN